MFLIKFWLSLKIRNDQKPRYSSWIMVIIIEWHNFKFFFISPSWLSYPTTSKHCYLCYGFLIPQFQNSTNFSSWNFFGLVIPHFFLELCRNYIMSIIFTIVSNMTVLVLQNIIFLGFFMPRSHDFNIIRRLLQAPPPPPSPLPGFHQVSLLFYNKCLIKLLLPWSDYL